MTLKMFQKRGQGYEMHFDLNPPVILYTLSTKLLLSEPESSSEPQPLCEG